MSPIYFNHAHNDYLELWLETGLAGAALFAAVRRLVRLARLLIWRRRIAAGGSSLAAACTLLVALLLAHSTVDYPLRTETIAVLFAFACGAIAAWRPDADARSATGAGAASAPSGLDDVWRRDPAPAMALRVSTTRRALRAIRA